VDTGMMNLTDHLCVPAETIVEIEMTVGSGIAIGIEIGIGTKAGIRSGVLESAERESVTEIEQIETDREKSIAWKSATMAVVGTEIVMTALELRKTQMPGGDVVMNLALSLGKRGKARTTREVGIVMVPKSIRVLAYALPQEGSATGEIHEDRCLAGLLLVVCAHLHQIAK